MVVVVVFDISIIIIGCDPLFLACCRDGLVARSYRQSKLLDSAKLVETSIACHQIIRISILEKLTLGFHQLFNSEHFRLLLIDGAFPECIVFVLRRKTGSALESVPGSSFIPSYQ